MKICCIITTLARGGAERVLLNLSSKFAEKKLEVLIITLFKAPAEYTIPVNIRRISLCEKSNSNNILLKTFHYTKALLGLRKHLKRELPDIAISFMAIPNFFLIIASCGIPIKTIFSVRNTPEFEYGKGIISKKITNWVLGQADGGVFQTQDAQKWFSSAIQKKSTVIFNPINNVFYEAEKRPIPGHIITCGRLEEQKNQKLLISAFSRVIKHHPESKLYIYGEGPLREVLQQQIQNLKLQNHVFLMGSISNVVEAFSKAEVFVLSSDFEGMPNALMEAMAIGIPCIATDCPCGGPRTLLKDGKNGILVPVNDEQAMSKAIIEMLDNEELKKQYEKRSKAAAANFTQDKICTKWLAYINYVVKGN